MSSLVISVLSSGASGCCPGRGQRLPGLKAGDGLYVALTDRTPPDAATPGTSKTNISLKIMASGLKAQLLSLLIG